MPQNEVNIIVTAKDHASRVIQGVSRSITNMATRALKIGTAALAAFGTAGIVTGAQLERTAVAMESLAGSTEKATELIKDAREFAAQTPFQFGDIVQAEQTLLGFGIAADQVMKDVRTLGDLAAVTGADYKSLAVVFGQVNATGRLMGQDALQLINNNIPITSMLAERLGVSVQEVKERMEDGAISVELFNETMQAATKEGGFAFQGMEKAADTLSGRFSTLKDNVFLAAQEFVGFSDTGKIVEGSLADMALNGIDNVIKAIQDPAFMNFLNMITKEWIPAIFDVGREVAEYLVPKLQALWNSLNENIIPIIVDLAQNIFPLLIGAIGLAIDTLNAIISVVDDLKWVLLALGGALVGSKVLGAFNTVTMAITGAGGIKPALAGLAKSLGSAAWLNPWTVFAAAAVVAFQTIMNKIDDYKEAIDGLRESTRRASDAFDNTIQQAKELRAEGKITQERFEQLLGTTVTNTTVPQLRATGGPVSANTPYIVGEKGAELFVPRTSGDIVPNDKLGGDTTVNINGSINLGDQGAVDRFFERINYKQEMARYGL